MTKIELWEFEGDVRVYLTDIGEYVVSERGQWVPGVYASIEAAKVAPGLDIDKLEALVNGAMPTPITVDQLKHLSD